MMPLGDKTLDSIIPTILSTPAVSISTCDTLGGAASLLPHHLEAFTDSLVATDRDTPVSIIGGVEVLDVVLKNQEPGFLDRINISHAMNRNLAILNPDNKLSDLVNHWSQTRRAFAIIPNKYCGYSAVSARKIWGLGFHTTSRHRFLQFREKRSSRFRKMIP